MRIPNPTIIPVKNFRWLIYLILLISTAIFLSRTSFSLSEYNDFDLSNSSVPVNTIFTVK